MNLDSGVAESWRYPSANMTLTATKLTLFPAKHFFIALLHRIIIYYTYFTTALHRDVAGFVFFIPIRKQPEDEWTFIKKEKITCEHENTVSSSIFSHSVIACSYFLCKHHTAHIKPHSNSSSA
ncbi:MAG: hypothetical protein ISR54_09165 [Chlorobium phaeobacteroides]|nr:hypothetical protein [Chlorobium phaeobacteroides]